jgi:hypothetical protein
MLVWLFHLLVVPLWLPFNSVLLVLIVRRFQPDGQGGGALESGIDTATSSTPLSLNLDIELAIIAENINVDIFVVHDSLYFIDQVGNLRIAL